METNLRGNTIQRGFDMADRYKFDFGMCRTWKQYDTDQDAPYFGVWVNEKTMQIFTYAEGDTSLVTCKDLDSYHPELKSMAEFYGPQPAAFTAINIENKTITKYYDNRPE